MNQEQHFMEKYSGRYAIRQAGILVRRSFATAAEAKSWAKDNYHSGKWHVERLSATGSSEGHSMSDPADWMPMDSAPKDRFILLYCEEDKSRWLAKWQDGRWYGIDDEGLTREGHSAGDPEVVTGWALTAWQDLPSPPTASQRA